jgi:Inorganic pyrophosphatase
MIEVLIQAGTGSKDKMRFDEKPLETIKSGRVSRPYPYPYGFVLDTTAPDGDNADCYVVGGDGVRSGPVVVCEVVGLLEQVESGGRIIRFWLSPLTRSQHSPTGCWRCWSNVSMEYSLSTRTPPSSWDVPLC